MAMVAVACKIGVSGAVNCVKPAAIIAQAFGLSGCTGRPDQKLGGGPSAVPGYTAKTDPDAWSIVDGKLYLNYSRRVRTRWLQDVPGNIAKGDANWPSVLG